MSILTKIRDFFTKSSRERPEAELEIFSPYCDRLVYIVYPPQGYAHGAATFDTIEDARRYADKMGWDLV